MSLKRATKRWNVDYSEDVGGVALVEMAAKSRKELNEQTNVCVKDLFNAVAQEYCTPCYYYSPFVSHTSRKHKNFFRLLLFVNNRFVVLFHFVGDKSAKTTLRIKAPGSIMRWLCTI